jgi:uroporphyrin-III C-methyltransferase
MQHWHKCRLVSEDILRMSSPEATLVYVGKQQGYHSRTQTEIHELLLRFAQAGVCVVRLKGGDPFVFGRGAEESQYLEARGVMVHIVPGITAASGISALLGVPLTHRGVATSVRFLTGHSQEGGADKLDATISAAANPDTTLVIYMGLGTLPSLVRQLTAHGLAPSVPAVAVERGTTRESRLCHGRVADLPQLTSDAGLKSPTLIIVGEVVALSPGWKMWVAGGEPLTQAAPLPLPLDMSHYQHNRTLVSQQEQQGVVVSMR